MRFYEGKHYSKLLEDGRPLGFIIELEDRLCWADEEQHTHLLKANGIIVAYLTINSEIITKAHLMGWFERFL